MRRFPNAFSSADMRGIVPPRCTLRMFSIFRDRRAFAGFSVNSVGATFLSFYDRFGNRKASISLISRHDDKEGDRHPAPASTDTTHE